MSNQEFDRANPAKGKFAEEEGAEDSPACIIPPNLVPFKTTGSIPIIERVLLAWPATLGEGSRAMEIIFVMNCEYVAMSSDLDLAA